MTGSINFRERSPRFRYDVLLVQVQFAHWYQRALAFLGLGGLCLSEGGDGRERRLQPN
jgi:hypothetical protein